MKVVRRDLYIMYQIFKNNLVKKKIIFEVNSNYNKLFYKYIYNIYDK